MASEALSRAAYIALLGAPNAGKSTLLNALVGEKLSIVTPKVQTTRMRVRAIAMVERTQLVFIDTPGVIAPRQRLERAMVAAAWAEVAQADAVLLLVDARRGIDADVGRILVELARVRSDATLVLNKIDLVAKPRLLALTAELNAGLAFTDTFMVSALEGEGVDDLRRVLAARAPEGPWLYPPDQLSDLNERLIAAEVTREQLFLRLHQEVPYSLAVATETWQDFADGSVRIGQTVYVRRATQKAIVLGQGGRTIKAVGMAARRALEAMLARRVHLMVEVKVRPRWSDDPERYRDLGLEFPD